MGKNTVLTKKSTRIMQQIVKNAIPRTDLRFVGFDKIYTSGGITAGIDLSFHIVEKLYGSAVAKNTAEYMEYYPHR